MTDKECITPLPIPEEDFVGDMSLDEILRPLDFSARCLSGIRKPWKDQERGLTASRIRQYVFKLLKIEPSKTVGRDEQESRDVDWNSPLPTPDWDMVRDMTMDQILRQSEIFARRLSEKGKPESDNEEGILVSRVRQYVNKINQAV